MQMVLGNLLEQYNQAKLCKSRSLRKGICTFFTGINTGKSPYFHKQHPGILWSIGLWIILSMQNFLCGGLCWICCGWFPQLMFGDHHLPLQWLQNKADSDWLQMWPSGEKKHHPTYLFGTKGRKRVWWKNIYTCHIFMTYDVYTIIYSIYLLSYTMLLI